MDKKAVVEMVTLTKEKTLKEYSKEDFMQLLNKLEKRGHKLIITQFEVIL